MANYDFFREDWEEHNPHNWEDIPGQLWDDVTNGRGWEDEYGKFLFDNAFIAEDLNSEERAHSRDLLKDWIIEEYGYDFDDVFDWETYREWYG